MKHVEAWESPNFYTPEILAQKLYTIFLEAGDPYIFQGKPSFWGPPAVCFQGCIWVFPKIGVPQNGWFIMEKPIKMDDLGVSLFRKHQYSQSIN